MSAKPQLCFVHGFGCGPNDWDLLRRELGGEWDSQAVDLGLFGSDAGEERSLAIVELAKRVTAAMAPGTVLVGHSMGCRVVLQAACDRPEDTAGVILVDGSRLVEADIDAFDARIARDPKAFASDLFSEMGGPGMTQETLDALVERAQGMSGAAMRSAFGGMLRWDRTRGSEALASLKDTPLLTVVSTTLGDDGRRRPLQEGESNPFLDCVAVEAKHAMVARILGVGHFPMLEKPADLAAAMRGFLHGL